MSPKSDVLTHSEFGSRVAEDEIDDLKSYFVETEPWRKLLGGEVDIVFGSKGAGKSALYSLLVAQKEVLRLGRRTMFIAAENPRGAPAFRDLTTAPPLSEEEFRGLWKLYFLTICADYLRHHINTVGLQDIEAKDVFDFLTSNGLLTPNANLISKLKAAFNYIRKFLPSLEASVTDPSTGLTYTGKIVLNEPSPEQKEQGFRSIDELLDSLNNSLKAHNITIWLALDRLDVAFSDSDELEGNAIRSLFRAYLDMLSLTHVRIKVFLRDDIWRKVVRDGFREASHVTKTLTLTWDEQSLLNLIVRRLASNERICQHFNVKRETILGNSDLQRSFFYRVFPRQIDSGARMPNTLDWMLSRTADGTKRTAPRELIHLLLATKDQQLKQLQLGHSAPENELLFDRNAIRAALPEVSKARYDQTLCAEHPSLKPYLDRLEGEKTQQSLPSLTKVWKCGIEKATELAEKLVETGFFERRGSKESPIFWVPFLYREALNLVQGSAD